MIKTKSQVEPFMRLEARMRYIIAAVFLLFLSACKEEKPKLEKKEQITLEKNDEIIKIDDKNLPLPVNQKRTK